MNREGLPAEYWEYGGFGVFAYACVLSHDLENLEVRAALLIKKPHELVVPESIAPSTGVPIRLLQSPRRLANCRVSVYAPFPAVRSGGGLPAVRTPHKARPERACSVCPSVHPGQLAQHLAFILAQSDNILFVPNGYDGSP